MKSVYTYASYREFLRDLYQSLKEGPGGYSYARFSKQLGLGSANYSQLIIEGKRSLSLAGAHRCADAFRMNDDERRYLETLVLLEGVSNPRDRSYYRGRLKEIKRKKLASRIRRHPGKELEHWYTLAVLVLIDGQSEGFSMNDLAARIGISATEARKSVDELIRSGLLRVDGGVYHQVAGQVTWSDGNHRNNWQKSYLATQLERTLTLFKSHYDSGPKFHAYTFTVGEEDEEYFASKIAAYVETLISEADQSPRMRVMQINFQAFALPLE